jgi:hypothetical protein
MTAFGTLPTDRRRSLILDLVAKYTYKILSANVCCRNCLPLGYQPTA